MCKGYRYVCCPNQSCVTSRVETNMKSNATVNDRCWAEHTCRSDCVQVGLLKQRLMVWSWLAVSGIVWHWPTANWQIMVNLWSIKGCSVNARSRYFSLFVTPHHWLLKIRRRFQHGGPIETEISTSTLHSGSIRISWGCRVRLRNLSNSLEIRH